MWCGALCDREPSRRRRPWSAFGRNLTAGRGGRIPMVAPSNVNSHVTHMAIVTCFMTLSHSVIRSIREECWSRLPGNPDVGKLHVIGNIMCHVSCRTLPAKEFGDKSSDLRSEFRSSSLPFPCPALPLCLKLAFGSLLVWRTKCDDLNSVWQLEDRPRVPRLVSCGYALLVCWIRCYIRLWWGWCVN
jgi:hypothetical protein